jgi:hypothetical protein
VRTAPAPVTAGAEHLASSYFIIYAAGFALVVGVAGA